MRLAGTAVSKTEVLLYNLSRTRRAMGSAQSQEQPEVVRIDREDIPEEYKTVGVSSDVVRRVNSQTRGSSPDAERLREELARERQEKQRLRDEMTRLTELQQRQYAEGSRTAPAVTNDIEERKRIFDETVQRVQEKFFAYHRENVCADHEKEIMSCLRENRGRVLQCAPLSKLYEKCASDFRQEVLNEVVPVWTLQTSNVSSFDGLRYHNCSMSTCLRLQRCMLRYDRISVYIQPLLAIHDENGNHLTPVPSKEFLAVRSMLQEFSVENHEEACLFFPGVDFMNLHRFPSMDAAHSVASMINERFYNVLMFTLVGQWKRTYRGTLASVVPPRHLYRHRLDMSLPPYATPRDPPVGVLRRRLTVMMFNASSSFREESARAFADSKNVTLLTACDSKPYFVCDAEGNNLDWQDVVQQSNFVVLHERMSHFNLALYRCLEASVIPVIFAPNTVLPFSDYIDWHLISLQPTSLFRVNEVLSRLSSSKEARMRSKIRDVHAKFSSLQGILNMTLRVLESRLLPARARTYEEYNMEEKHVVLPHLEPPAHLMLLVWSDSATAAINVQDIRQLSSAEILSSAVVIWGDESYYPSQDAWEFGIPIQIFTGVRSTDDLTSVMMRSMDDALLITPHGSCRLGDNTIWRTQSDRPIFIPCGALAPGAVIVKKMLFLSSLPKNRSATDLNTFVQELLQAHSGLHVVARDHMDSKCKYLLNNDLMDTCSAV
ncbi:hypothetical protein Q1695_012469 [Nippostrongylus brasiliensis]|nr:hypothetical protein Q1695_012469 [Nippostrongylus brasiliensis]